MWYVYILKCYDGSFYTGICSDLNKRLKRHNSGKGSKYTKVRRPVAIVYTEEYPNRSLAFRRERVIKDFGIENKNNLIKFWKSAGVLPRS